MILKKKLPAPWNRTMWVSTRSYRRYFYRSLGYVHADLLEAVKRWVKPGSVVWDIGANMGVFSFGAAQFAGPTGSVFAFEADVECAALMTCSLEIRGNEEAPIVVCPFVIAAESGIVPFEISSYRTAASAIQGFGRFESRGTVRRIPAFSLDELALRFAPPNVIKIDVEGAENLVFQGARQTMERFRPTVLVECSGGSVGEETGELFRTMNYEWKPWLCDGAFGQDAPLVDNIVALSR